MNTGLFLVTRTHGSEWDEARTLEEQQQWPAHAGFMEALASEGFVVLGGPIADTRDALLVVRASDPAQIEQRLAQDPWTESDLLWTTSIQRWQLRLGTLPARPDSSGSAR